MNEVERKTGTVGDHPSPLYRFARIIAGLIFHTLCPIVYHGREKLPESGPCIVISNHFSNWDPLVLGFAIKKTVIFLGKKELEKLKIMKWVFRNLHMIPIDRHNTDMTAMRKCIKVLKEGEILGIFPEGTRHHEGIMENVEDGVALLALRSGVSPVPVLIPSKVRPFHVTHVYVGDRIPVEDLRAVGINKNTCGLFMDRMKASYRGLIQSGETHGSVD